MKTLIKYLNEKLVINKNYVGRFGNKKLNNITDAAKEIKKVVNNDLNSTDQIKMPNDMYGSNDILQLIRTDKICNDIKSSCPKDYFQSINWLNEHSIRFQLRSIPKSMFFISFVENDFFMMDVTEKSAKLRDIITDIMKKYDVEIYKKDNGRQYWGNNKKIQDSYYWIALNINYGYNEFVELVCDFIRDLYQELGIGVINREMKQDEVIPGWTLDDIKKRYDKIFDDIKVMRSGNVKLGHLKEHGIDHSYENSTFRIDTDIDYRNGIMIGRRLDGSSSSGNNFVLKPTADEAFDELDNKLRKKGYKL